MQAGGLARRLGRGAVALRRLDSGLRRNDEVGGAGIRAAQIPACAGMTGWRRRDGGMWLVSEGRRRDGPDNRGQARWFGRWGFAPGKLDSGLRRNDGLRVPG